MLSKESSSTISGVFGQPGVESLTIGGKSNHYADWKILIFFSKLYTSDGHSLSKGSYSSAEMQLAYSTDPADWVDTIIALLGTSLYWDSSQTSLANQFLVSSQLSSLDTPYIQPCAK